MLHCFLNQSPVPLNLGSPIVRLSVFFLAAATLTSFNIAAGTSAIAETRYAQYYPQQHYGYPPPGYRPPCNAVTPGPFQGRDAARREALLSARFRVMPGAAPQSGRLRRSPQRGTARFGPQCGRLLLRRRSPLP